jgi:uncharacterized membrane protein (UPF0182 family)
VIDAYNGATTFYVFDKEDPIIAADRNIFPSLFKDAARMPPGLRKHMRYPELLLKLQAEVYGLYYMTDPGAFYNREDLWTVATEVGMSEGGQQVTQAMQPNFVLMKLPGETGVEFVEILPFTPANRNNLIGWIAGRSDGAQYGTSVVCNSPKRNLSTELCKSKLSGQLTLVESARLPRAARSVTGNSIRACVVVRGTHLPAGRTEPNARVASGRARGARSACVRTNLRVGNGSPFWWSGLVT